MTVLYWLIQLTWGFPQTIAGALLTAFFRLFFNSRKCVSADGSGESQGRQQTAPRSRFFRAVVTKWPLSGSMALGGFLFLAGDAEEEIAVHEYGHTVQSMILGPLFLPVIGIPSLIWANLPALKKYRAKNKKRYTSFYPERWASFAGERSTGLKAYRA